MKILIVCAIFIGWLANTFAEDKALNLIKDSDNISYHPQIFGLRDLSVDLRVNHLKNYLKEKLVHIRNFLQNKLSLTLHPDKVFIKTLYSGVDFYNRFRASNHPRHIYIYRDYFSFYLLPVTFYRFTVRFPRRFPTDTHPSFYTRPRYGAWGR